MPDVLRIMNVILGRGQRRRLLGVCDGQPDLVRREARVFRDDLHRYAAQRGGLDRFTEIGVRPRGGVIEVADSGIGEGELVVGRDRLVRIQSHVATSCGQGTETGRWMEARTVSVPVFARVARRNVWVRPPDVVVLRLAVVISEAAVRQAIGGREVMAEQLRHLVQMGELPNISIRVMPLAAGLHDGLISNDFSILRFSGDNELPMVYSDVLLGGLWFEEPREIKRFGQAFADIGGRALGEQASRNLIDQTVKELARDA
nr:DUF5753 domain-containing protein [Micromonospora sp. DSM 115978]